MPIPMRSSSISFAAKKGTLFCDPNIANHEKFELSPGWVYLGSGVFKPFLPTFQTKI